MAAAIAGASREDLQGVFDRVTTDLQQVKHFWVASGPFVESYILFIPALSTAAVSSSASAVSSSASANAKLEFFDADGALANEIEVGATPGQPSVFEVGQFLGSCKLESGVRHAHLVVRSSEPMWCGCRLVSGSSASMLGEPDLINSERNGFMPVIFSPTRRPLLCVVNHSGEEVHLRCQLFFGARIPETELSVAAFGARLLALDTEFEQQIPKENQKTIRAYLRFGMKGGGAVGVQMLELYPGPRNEEFVSAVG